jgi:uncharacterized protein (TIGR02147 family)
MRAFAKVIGVSPAMLSLVHNGKRNLTPVHALKVAKHLGLNSKESQYFSLLVQLETAKTPEAQSAILDRLNELNPARQISDFSLDAFAVIAEWYHFPMLQLIKVKTPTFSAKSAANRLGITQAEAEAAIGRLTRLGLIQKIDGRYARVGNDLRAQSEHRNDALRMFHKQMLQKAIESLEQQSPNEKYVGSETIAIDARQLPQIKRMIDTFFDEMNSMFERGGEPTEVYHFGIQFFKLTGRSQ